MTPKFLLIHHSAVIAKADSDQYKGINNNHKERFNFPSKSTGSFVGYHYLIRPDGMVTQTRADDEVGAHCKENRMNFQSIGICLEGNFDVDKPTDKQVFALRDLMRKLCKKYVIKSDKIALHRDLAPYKSCPGKNIKRDFIRSLVAKS